MNRIAQRMISSVARQARTLIQRGELLLHTENKISLAQIRLGLDGVFDQVERFQNYGFTSSPLPGAEVVTARMGSDIVIIVTDDRRYRPITLQPGEVAIYTDEGDHILLSRAGIILKSSRGIIMDGDVTIHGTVTAHSVTDTTGSMEKLRGVFNSHVHNDPLTGTTSPPTGTM